MKIEWCCFRSDWQADSVGDYGLPSSTLGADQYDDDILRDMMRRQNDSGQPAESTWTRAEYAAVPAGRQSEAMTAGHGDGRLASAYSSDSK